MFCSDRAADLARPTNSAETMSDVDKLLSELLGSDEDSEVRGSAAHRHPSAVREDSVQTGL